MFGKGVYTTYYISVRRHVPGGIPGEVWRVDLRAGTAQRLQDGAEWALDFGALADALADGAATLSRRPPLQAVGPRPRRRVA